MPLDVRLLITLDRVVALHHQQIERHGGLHGLKDPGTLESSLMSAHLAADYASDTPGVLDPLIVASYLMYKLVRNHSFNDGNKRIGWVAMQDVLLAELDCKIIATDDEAERFTLRVAAGEHTEQDVLDWISARLGPAPR